MSNGLERIKARIRALLAKTVANGCTEGEALAAAEKAFAMMCEHGLSHDELSIGRSKAPTLKSRRTPLDDLWITVATVCRCQAVVQYGCGLDWVYIGPEPWPEVAVWLQGTLTGAHGRALEDFRKSAVYQRRRVARTRAAARRQFTVGFVDQVRLKLWEMARAQLGEIKRDLAIVERATKQELQDTRSLDHLGKASNARNLARDRAAGQDAGRRTNVNWGVQGSTPKLLA